MAQQMEEVGNIRPAVPADLPQILDIERLCFEKQWREGYFCPAFQDTFFVYEEKEEILGFIIACTCETAQKGTIMRVAVHPKARGRGVASELMAAAIQTLKEKNVLAVELDVETSKEDVKRLYEKLGFVTAKLVSIDCDYEDEAFYVMELQLA